MSDDMNKKIQQIAELLGQETMPDNVKGLLSLLAGSLDKKEDETPAATVEEDNPEPVKEERPVRAEAGNDSEMLNRVKKLASSIGAGNDPRINLLHAIKPFMNSNRQKKIGNCIQLLQMSGFARLLDNQDK